MAKSKKPRVTVKCNADTYASDGERIIEFMDDTLGKGGLISFRRRTDGKLQIDVYRCDPGVVVNGSEVKSDA